MAAPSDLKQGQYLEWYTQLPYANCPRESPSFIFQNTECYFQFARVEAHNFEYRNRIYMKHRKDPIQLQPFRMLCYIRYNGAHFFSLDDSDSAISNTEISILCVQESVFKKVRETTSCDPFIRILFIFLDEFGLTIQPMKFETNEKSVQTPPYLDARLSSELLSRDLGTFMDTDSDHDTQFICGDRTFKAHKSVLGTRSSVLKAMFQSDMVEGKTGMVQIKDVESTVFEKFLRYVYTGKLPELTVEMAKGLYGIGDKYSVEALKKECGSYLLDNLSKDNACEMLVLADQHSDPDFKEKIVMYILQEKVPTTNDDWEDFCGSHPMLAIQVLNSICQSFMS